MKELDVREKLKSRISDAVDETMAIDFLKSLIHIPSESTRPVYAQELVRMKMEELGFSIESFPCETESLKDLDDFCNFKENMETSEDIYNIAAVKQGKENEKTLMLFSHIDTSERSEIIPDFHTEEKDGRIYGLGAADSKGGVALMLMAVQTVLKIAPELKNRLILLSTIGKRGSIGTLTAVRKGYRADAAVYLHPAETGHGFQEIKNYSMGAMDFIIDISGKPGVYRDEIDDSEISAIIKGGEMITAIEKWNQKRRKEHFFKEDTFKNLSNTKVNFLNAFSSELYREDALHFQITCRMCFGLEEDIHSVMDELKEYLREYFADDAWFSENPPQIRYGEIKATPVYVSRDTDLIRSVEANIKNVKHNDDFIYQYHASSDIRIPVVYGKTPTVGIGPLCGGLNEKDSPEWVDKQDYIDGIKIVSGLIIDWCM